MADPRLGVVGVDQEGGVRTEGLHLGGESGALITVGQYEGVGRGTGRRESISTAGLEVGRAGEAGDPRCPGRRTDDEAAEAMAESWLRIESTSVSSKTASPKPPSTVRTGDSAA